MDDDIYRENILDHYKHPRNFGSLKNSTTHITDSLISCGDELEMDIVVENNKLTDICFNGKGCAISMAAASMLTEVSKGKSIADLKRFTPANMVSLLGIPLTPTRLKCALLSLQVLHKAINE